MWLSSFCSPPLSLFLLLPLSLCYLSRHHCDAPRCRPEKNNRNRVRSTVIVRCDMCSLPLFWSPCVSPLSAFDALFPSFFLSLFLCLSLFSFLFLSLFSRSLSLSLGQRNCLTAPAMLFRGRGHEGLDRARSTLHRPQSVVLCLNNPAAKHRQPDEHR